MRKNWIDTGKILLILSFICTLNLPAQQISVTQKDVWNGFDRSQFSLEGRKCYLVKPKQAAQGKPWIWRARFWGHEPQLDLALLRQGFHLAYIDVAELYGNDKAVKLWDNFYKLLTVEYRLSPKPVLECMSRGGLIAYNWASKNPDQVACIYADAPVCDIRSWPGGKGKGKGSAAAWEVCKKAHGLREETLADFEGNPLDNLPPLAKAGVPLIHVVGMADEVVPVAENTAILSQKYRALGGQITVIEKEGIGHHPHSLEHPIPLIEFIFRQFPQLKYEPTLNTYFQKAAPLVNSYQAIRQKKRARIAYLGGSITFNPGWREKLSDYMQARFPEAELEFINAGIPSLGSTPDVFRMQTDVLEKGKIDLLFVEAAVNDETNGRTATEQVRAMEGIVRKTRLRYPSCDIIFMYFVDPDKIAVYNEGQIPEVIKQHQRVADHYDIPSLDLALEVTEHLNAGKFSWEEDFIDLHPSPFGQEFYYQSMKHMMDHLWTDSLNDQSVTVHSLPDPLDQHHYALATRKQPIPTQDGNGWKYHASWEPAQAVNTRPGFVHVPMLVATDAEAALTYSFQGQAIGIWVIAGPDVGILSYQVDDGPVKQLDQFTRWSSFLHLPWVYMLETQLSPGPHRLRLRTTAERNPASKGNACRIVYFLEN